MEPVTFGDDPLEAVTPELAARLPAALARKLGVVPLAHEPTTRTLVVAMADPAQLAAIDEVAFATGLKVRATMADASELRRAIARLYPDAGAPAPRGRSSVPPPVLPKLISYEESERRSRRWMAIIAVVLGCGATLPFAVWKFIKRHRNDRPAVRADGPIDHGDCPTLPGTGWRLASPGRHDEHRTDQTSAIDVCESSKSGSDGRVSHRLISATVRSPGLADEPDGFAARALDELAEPLADEVCRPSALRSELTVVCDGYRERMWAWRLDEDRYRVVVVRVGVGELDDQYVTRIEETIVGE